MTQTAPTLSQDIVLVSTNPARGFEVLGQVTSSSEADVQTAVAAARAAQPAWAGLELEKRIEYMQALKKAFLDNRDKFIHLTAQEMGMPLGLSASIVDGAIGGIEWDCAHAAEYLVNEVLYEDEKEINELRYEPYGVIACIVAWNFPLGNFAVSTSQALLVGNTMVMKYSEEVPLFCKFLEEVIAGCDFPEGVINFVYGDGQVGAFLTDQQVDFISFTGSSATGKKIYQKAAEKLIPVSLEMGGSSPGIVFEDCAVDDALIEKLFWGRFLNSAQFCDGMKRLIVHKSLMDDLITKLATYAEQKIMGDPTDEKTELGPLVAQRQVDKLEVQLKDALDKGATLHCGGQRPEGLDGAYFQPTILSNISKDMKVWTEEVFGPILPIVGFDSYEEAIELANDTEYGLSGLVFTADPDLKRQALLDLKAGSVSDGHAHFYRPQNPFGGYKASGIGRQGGKHGFHEVSQIKVLAWEK